MPKMRLGWYAGASTALAGGVVLSAFHQRANYYSAMVYLAQSNFCLIVMVNFTLLLYSSFIFALTRLCFGRLRAIEVEVLTERAWFAITETCLAMTIFRDEIGAWFLVMFTSLVTGKVWGWICDGRVEILEQQPPANPRLFHTRLSISLVMSFLYDVLILRYATQTVIQQAKRNMMVMFLFEFAVLTTSSWRTGLRYILSLTEQHIIKQQTQKKLLERRAEVRRQREEMLAERAPTTGTRESDVNQEALPDENDIEEMDIEVPGWTAKGEWVLWLDLMTDMIKLAIYVAFFFMLLTFFGFPIHIIRDLFMTTRDFFKRLRALLRYRKAIQEMNMYPDATEDELARENTCIICREEMRPWDANGNPEAIDRVRPKRLPCGHILHLGCLKSWLERQQVCPTCRSPVTGAATRPQADNAAAMRLQIGGGPPPLQGQQPAANGPIPNPGHNQPQPQQAPAQQPPQPEQHQNNGPRIFNIGPFRVGLAGNQQQFNQLMGRWQAFQQNIGGRAPAPAPAPAAAPAPHAPMPMAQAPAADQMVSAARQLELLMQTVVREFQNLVGVLTQLQEAQRLLTEAYRLQQAGQTPNGPSQPGQGQAEADANARQLGRSPESLLAEARQVGQLQQQLMELGQAHRALDTRLHDTTQFSSPTAPAPAGGAQALGMHPNQLHTANQAGAQAPFPQGYQVAGHPLLPPGTNSSMTAARHGTSGYAIPSGSSELPEGLVIPPGWSLMPLQRLDGHHAQPTQPLQHAGPSNQPGYEALNSHNQTPAPTVPVPVPASSDPSATASSQATEPIQPTLTPTVVRSDNRTGNPSSTSPKPVPDAPATLAPTVSAAEASTTAPQWGGPSQLFPNSQPSFANRVGSSSTTSTATAAIPSSQNPQSNQRPGAGQAQRTQPPPTHESSEEESDCSSSGEDEQHVQKGKGRAVTVESDDDEDSD